MREPHLFIFGLGYVGLRVGIACERDLGWRVSGSCRNQEKADAVSAASDGRIAAHTFDLDEEYSGLDAGGLAALSDATHVLATTPPIADFDRDPLLALHTPALLEAAQRDLRWAGYLSTTSVYGDHAGAWVDEDAETRAAVGSPGQLRIAAENDWLSLEDATDGSVQPHIFRLAGIYGPGRSALETVARAAASAAPPSSSTPPPPPSPPPSPPPPLHAAPLSATPAPTPRYVSRVHVDDVSAALLASMVEPPPSAYRMYNLADDEPTPRAEVMAFAAELLGVPDRAASDADAEGAGRGRARRRAAEHKRVTNDRMRSTLLPDGLRYPSFREGLRDGC